MTTPLVQTQSRVDPSRSNGVAHGHKDDGSVLQAFAIQMSELTSDELSLKVLWERLSSGFWRVHDSFSTIQRFYFVMEAGLNRPVPCELLLRTLLGSRQKVVALELRRSQSTITSKLSSALVAMGLAPQASRVPALLVASAVAGADLAELPLARATRIDCAGVERFTVSVARLDEPLAAILSPQEHAVMRSLVDGHSYLEISRTKKRSIRRLVFAFGMSWGPCVWVLLGEMFPNSVRGAAMAVAVFAQWMANWLVTIAFPPTVASAGPAVMYGVYLLFAVVSFVFVRRLVHETKGRTLEEA